MTLDIRLPTGLLFTVLGLILVGYGMMADPAIYERSLGYNVNLIWGVVLIVFGAINLYLGRTGTSTVRLAEEAPEGRAIEALEHRTGKESD